MTYNREYTPEFITSLQPNEVFVFGSNIRGMHGGGAAAIACRKFGAEWGIGEGLTGQCYALPTMEGGVDYIADKVQNFITCAKSHPEKKFYSIPSLAHLTILPSLMVRSFWQSHFSVI